jgi:SAM-dependent methyltransferase
VNAEAVREPSPLPDASRRASLSEGVCLLLARLFLTGPLARVGLRHGPAAQRFESEHAHISDRRHQADEYNALFSRFSSFSGKTVLDLGSSSGYLLDEFLKRQSFRAIGVDSDAREVEEGRRSYGDRILFVQSTAASIPLPDASVDIVYSVDTFEHLSRPREMLLDVHRILRPGGLVLIHFHPWLGPCGSHLEDIIPFPWPNVFFSLDTLLRVAGRLYESSDYAPACYWIDRETGARRENPYLDHQRWDDFLNRMSVRRFRRLLPSLPFSVVAFRPLGFGGRHYRVGRLLRPLARVPLLNELFTSAVFCVLRK